MQLNTQVEHGKGVLRLGGRFDFNCHRDFRTASEPLLENRSVEVLQVDLAGVDYMDSSALGMLLMLRDKAQSQKKRVEICGAQGNVRQILEIANFDKLFPIV
jgi:anti-anti-sigma factor